MFDIFLAGAEKTGGYQPHVADSTGGFRSINLAPLYSLRRNENCIRNIVITDISQECGKGAAQLRAVNTSQVVFIEPGSLKSGAATTLEKNVKTVVPGFNTSKTVEVLRIDDNPILGNETFEILDRFNNIVGGVDVDITDSTSAPVNYWCFFVDQRNISDLEITSNSAHLKVAFDPSTTGELTSNPAGLSFFGTASLPPAVDFVGVWIQRTTPLSATQKIDSSLTFDYSGSTTTHTHTLTGSFRVFDENLDAYLVYQDGSLVATSATLPVEFTPVPGLNEIVLRKRNKYGLISSDDNKKTVYVDAASDEIDGPPVTPDTLNVSTVGAKIKIHALASTFQQDAVRPTKWKVWVAEASGSYSVSADYEYDILASGLIQLIKELDHNFIDGEEIKVKVCTATDTYDSPPIETTHTIATLPSQGGLVSAFTTGAMNIYSVTPAPDFTHVLDATSDLTIVVKPTTSTLYLGSTLIWKTVWVDLGGFKTYVSNDWTIELDQVITGSSTRTAPIVYESSKIFINTGSSRRVEIDPATKKIKHLGRSWIQAPALEIAPPYPVWARKNDTTFASFCPERGEWVVTFDVNTSGLIRTYSDWSSIYTAAQIEDL